LKHGKQRADMIELFFAKWKYVKELREWKAQTLFLLKNVCHFIELHTDYIVSTKLLIPTGDIKYSFYRIYFTDDCEEWLCIDVPRHYDLEEVLDRFFEKLIEKQYFSVSAPSLPDVNDLRVMDHDEFVDNAVYSKYWEDENPQAMQRYFKFRSKAVFGYS
jgi:adenylate kinase family enzyme